MSTNLPLVVWRAVDHKTGGTYWFSTKESLINWFSSYCKDGGGEEEVGVYSLQTVKIIKKQVQITEEDAGYEPPEAKI